MDLTQMAENEFLCDGARTDGAENPLAFKLGLDLIEELGHNFLKELSSGYELHQLCGQPEDIVLVKGDEVVGFYIGESLALHQDHQRCGLSTPLILTVAVAAHPRRAVC